MHYMYSELGHCTPLHGNVMFRNFSLGHFSESLQQQLYLLLCTVSILVLPCLKGGGGANRFGPAIFPFCSPLLPVMTLIPKLIPK